MGKLLQDTVPCQRLGDGSLADLATSGSVLRCKASENASRLDCASLLMESETGWKRWKSW